MDIPLTLQLPARGRLLPQFGRMVRDLRLWRLMAYQLVRLPVALLTGALTVIAWALPLVVAVIAAVFFVDLTVASINRPHLRPADAWTGAPLLLLALLVPVVPYLVRWMQAWQLALARRYLGQLSAEQLAARVFEVERSREDAMAAAETERRRIERDLHDGAQQQLVALAMLLGRAKRKYDTDPDATRALLEEAHRSAKDAIVELRELTRGLIAAGAGRPGPGRRAVRAGRPLRGARGDRLRRGRAARPDRRVHRLLHDRRVADQHRQARRRLAGLGDRAAGRRRGCGSRSATTASAGRSPADRGCPAWPTGPPVWTAC